MSDARFLLQGARVLVSHDEDQLFRALHAVAAIRADEHGWFDGHEAVAYLSRIGEALPEIERKLGHDGVRRVLGLASCGVWTNASVAQALVDLEVYGMIQTRTLDGVPQICVVDPEYHPRLQLRDVLYQTTRWVRVDPNTGCWEEDREDRQPRPAREDRLPRSGRRRRPEQ